MYISDGKRNIESLAPQLTPFLWVNCGARYTGKIAQYSKEIGINIKRGIQNKSTSSAKKQSLCLCPPHLNALAIEIAAYHLFKQFDCKGEGVGGE